MSIQVYTYTVFLSYALADREAANRAKLTLQEAGFDVTDPVDIRRASEWDDTLRTAVAEADAMVVVVDPAVSLAANIAVEMGAGLAWHKPIYVLRTSMHDGVLPQYFAKLPTFSMSRVDDLALQLMSQLKPLSDEDCQGLRDAYLALGKSVDQLLLKQAWIDELAQRFTEITARKASAEQLIQELVRMRKAGVLPRLHR
jgi:hypothetical protein